MENSIQDGYSFERQLSSLIEYGVAAGLDFI